MLVLGAESLKLLIRLEILKCPVQHGGSLLIQYAVIHALGVVPPFRALVCRPVEQAVLGKQVKVDQIRVARKGGERLIGRIAEARGVQRQYLPIFLTRRAQEIDEFIRRLA